MLITFMDFGFRSFLSYVSHMNIFTTYKPIKEDMVFAANDNSCKVVGIRTIKIKMFDRVVRTSDVHCVLDLRRNLIYLNT